VLDLRKRDVDAVPEDGGQVMEQAELVRACAIPGLPCSVGRRQWRWVTLEPREVVPVLREQHPGSETDDATADLNDLGHEDLPQSTRRRRKVPVRSSTELQGSSGQPG